MGILDIFKKNMEKSGRFKELSEEMKIRKLIEERSKSSNERELERFYEEEREKKIKQNLEEFRKHRQADSQKTTVLGGGNNMFKGKGNMMSGETTVLKNNDKMFSMKSGSKQKGMFFK
jgi:predicted RND superfamily exporter protein